MARQPLHINHTPLDQPYRPRPHVRVPVLELQINLLRAEPHEWDVDDVAADANDEDFAPELDSVDRRGDGRGDAGAFDGDGGLVVAGELEDCIAELQGRLRGRGRADEVCFYAGHQFLGEGEPASVDVCYDEGNCTCRLTA